MAKAEREHTKKAPITSSTGQLVFDDATWLALSEAFERVMARIGRDRAEREMVEHFQERRIEIARRGPVIPFDPSPPIMELINPALWRSRRLEYLEAGPQFPGGPTLRVRGSPRLFSGDLFVRRSDLDKYYSVAVPDPAKQLPTDRPEGIGPAVWFTAGIVLGLVNERYRWPSLDALLRKIVERVGSDAPSERTLDAALHYLRENGLIDR